VVYWYLLLLKLIISDLRGNLWIASTIKNADYNVTAAVESEYKLLKTVGHLPFPDSYPTSVLLGCVDIIDVLHQVEYYEKYPDAEEENGSQYLFICKNPRKLRTPFPISGQHKLWKLEEQELTLALSSLEF